LKRLEMAATDADKAKMDEIVAVIRKLNADLEDWLDALKINPQIVY